MKMTNEDRRRFFRITDAIGVSYTLVDTTNDTSEQEGGSVGDAVNAHQLLDSHNQAIKTALTALKANNAVAAEAVSAVDKKLNTIITLMQLDELKNSGSTQHVQQASISACGIAFPVSENIPSSTKMNLTLHLEESNEQVSALGQVIDCKALPEEKAYYLRVEFVDMQNTDREKLIQHIVQRQGTLLRSLKEQME